VLRADNLTTFLFWLCRNSGASTSEPQGPVQACSGKAFLLNSFLAPGTAHVLLLRCVYFGRKFCRWWDLFRVSYKAKLKHGSDKTFFFIQIIQTRKFITHVSRYVIWISFRLDTTEWSLLVSSVHQIQRQCFTKLCSELDHRSSLNVYMYVYVYMSSSILVQLFQKCLTNTQYLTVSLIQFVKIQTC
jgi:hypothetical protein